MKSKDFAIMLEKSIGFKRNDFHPLVWINGEPEIGENVYIGGLSEINANKTSIKIGDNCDIASFVSINAVDSHKKCIGIDTNSERKSIHIGNNVFIGSHSVIKGGANIGHHSVVAAGTIVEGIYIEPYSLVVGNPMVVKNGYYNNFKKNDTP